MYRHSVTLWLCKKRRPRHDGVCGVCVFFCLFLKRYDPTPQSHLLSNLHPRSLLSSFTSSVPPTSSDKNDKTEIERLFQHPFFLVFSPLPTFSLCFFHPLRWSCQTAVLRSSPNVIDPESKSDRELVSLPLSLFPSCLPPSELHLPTQSTTFSLPPSLTPSLPSRLYFIYQG